MTDAAATGDGPPFYLNLTWTPADIALEPGHLDIQRPEGTPPATNDPTRVANSMRRSDEIQYP
jgi:hypothetical protein